MNLYRRLSCFLVLNAALLLHAATYIVAISFYLYIKGEKSMRLKLEIDVVSQVSARRIYGD